MTHPFSRIFVLNLTFHSFVALHMFACSAQSQVAEQLTNNKASKVGVNALDDTQVAEWIRKFEKSGSLGREEIIGELSRARIEPKISVPVLVHVLKQVNHPTRTRAAKALIKIGSPAMGPLMASFKATTGREKAAIASVICCIGELPPATLEQLALDQDPRVRVVAARHTSLTTDSGSRLAIRMLKDSEPAVVIVAVRRLAMCRLNRRLAIDAMIPHINSDILGTAVVKSLAEYGMDSRRAIPWLLRSRFHSNYRKNMRRIGLPHREDITKIGNLLFHERRSVRVRAAELLAKIGPDAAVVGDKIEEAIEASLKKLLKPEENEGGVGKGVKVEGGGGEGGGGGVDSTEAEKDVMVKSVAFDGADFELTYLLECLLTVLNKPDRFLEIHEELAISKRACLEFWINSPWEHLGKESLPAIRKMLQHKRPEVRLTAMANVYFMGAKASPLKDEIAKFLKGYGDDMRGLAQHTLIEMGADGGRLAMPLLLSELKNKEIGLSEFAEIIEALGIRSKQLQEILEKGLQDEDVFTVDACAAALPSVTMNHKKCAKLLIDAAKADRFDNRRLAIKALSELQLEDGIYQEFLIHELSCGDILASHDAAMSLIKFGKEATAAVEPLKHLFDEEHLRTRMMAGAAYFSITNHAKPFRQLIEKALKDSDDQEGVRIAVLLALIELGSEGVAFQEYVLDENYYTFSYAHQCLIEFCGKVNSMESRVVLNGLVKSKNWEIHLAAKKALLQTTQKQSD